jgi:NADH:ubiquinone oxidoreductase subunit 5 (subunit L)/multisubunit Na+/H+ antiporter MnhA subunit
VLPRQPFLQRTLEHKLWFDELYDAVFYRAADRLIPLGRRWFEEPVIQGSIAEVSGAARDAGGAVGEAQTGFLRSYALAIAVSVAILVVVFVSVQ